MTTEPVSSEPQEKKVKVKVQGGSSDTVYMLGMVGACMYYMSLANTPQEKVKAFFKAFIWPVVVVRDLLKFLNKE